MSGEYVAGRFTANLENIRALMERDAGFRQVCEDYESVSTWLTHHCRSQARTDQEYARARDVSRELEREIEHALRRAGYEISGSRGLVFKVMEGGSRSGKQTHSG